MCWSQETWVAGSCKLFLERICNSCLTVCCQNMQVLPFMLSCGRDLLMSLFFLERWVMDIWSCYSAWWVDWGSKNWCKWWETALSCELTWWKGWQALPWHIGHLLAEAHQLVLVALRQQPSELCLSADLASVQRRSSWSLLTSSFSR